MARPKAERLESLTVDVPLSPQQAFVGGQMRILVPAREVKVIKDGWPKAESRAPIRPITRGSRS